MNEKIDFVITWVDESDPKWQKDFEDYSAKEGRLVNRSDARYRDWGTLRYWFRGVEKCAPWVNNIFFVTSGHLPKWLNTDHPKIRIVKHSDFIPAEYLPTFNSNVIEFYFHKIKGLSDQFVYFNDDCFLLKPIKPTRFFRNGLPCDIGALLENDHQGMLGVSVYVANSLINSHFCKRKAIIENFIKWFNPAYPYYSMRNMLYFLVRTRHFNGFEDHHLPQGYMKKTYDEVWKYYQKDLIRTSKSKLREYGDVTSWLLRYWQLASGMFSPFNVVKDGKCYYLGMYDADKVIDTIIFKKKSIICLNDSDYVLDFELYRNSINNAFERIMPEKSEYELH